MILKGGKMCGMLKQEFLGALLCAVNKQNDLLFAKCKSVCS